jgi:membrane protease YdiL (CAAX protease family)
MSSTDSSEMPGSKSSYAKGLVVNQTIGLLAVTGLVVAVLRSARVQALLSRTSVGTYIANWIATKALAVRHIDALLVVGMTLLMIGWTVLLQKVIARGGAVSQAEWRPETSGGSRVAVYLAVSASFVEEVLFRGIVLPAAAYYLGPLGGLIASAALFGLLHFEKGRLGQLVVVGYGVILGGGLLLGSSLLACVLAHASANLLAFFIPKKLEGGNPAR